MDFKKYSNESLQEMYKDACDAYEAGEPIMSDEEYDSLVQYLGIENTANIGSRSKSKAYTIQHSFIMGSLDKVHTEKDKETGTFNFDEVITEVSRHLGKAAMNGTDFWTECSPKYDGCSFSIEIRPDEPNPEKVITVATRGDGAFGANIKQHMLANNDMKQRLSLDVCLPIIKELLNGQLYDTFIIRGEALIDKNVYEKKYADKFKNTRVFVSGVMNRDFCYEPDFLDMCNDISYVAYDFRMFHSISGDYKELPWNNPNDSRYTEELSEKLGSLCKTYPQDCVLYRGVLNNASDMQMIYNKFAEFRTKCPFQLDGIVIKPNCSNRRKNFDRVRPMDMIAVKYVAEEMFSEIENIEWSVGQTGECYPVAIVKPVYQDGKTITRASLHGYSYIKTNNVGIGSKISMVMNGDIIPGVDKVLSEGELSMPEFETYIEFRGQSGTPHLMKKFTDDELQKHKFVSSAKALIIDGIAAKTAEKIWDVCHNEYDGVLDNLMKLMNTDGYNCIYKCMGESKSTNNIIKSLKNYRKIATLTDVIRGFCFDGCGQSVSEQCARRMSGLLYDMTGLNYSAYAWVESKESERYLLVEDMRKKLGVEYLTDAPVVLGAAEKIPVIMTGDPSKCCDYATKKEWLAAHPQYVETTKWTDCKILFTSDLSSTTGKMAKAAKYGTEVRLYEN